MRLFSCPAENRWDGVSSAAEQEEAIRLLGLEEYRRDFAAPMVGQLVVQLRSYPVGARVDDWIWNHLPELLEQQEQSVRTQLDEGGKALSPEMRRWTSGLIYPRSMRRRARCSGNKESRFSVALHCLGGQECPPSLA